MSYSARPWIWTFAVYIIKFYFRTYLLCSLIEKKVVLKKSGAYLPLCSWKVHSNPGLGAEGQFSQCESKGELFCKSKTVSLVNFLLMAQFLLLSITEVLFV